jgi:hypothetical protein
VAGDNSLHHSWNAVDRTAEIATLRQKLAAAEADKDNVFIQERGRHNATKAGKDNTFKPSTSWESA